MPFASQFTHIYVPFYAFIIRTVVTSHVSYRTQFTHIYNLHAWLYLFSFYVYIIKTVVTRYASYPTQLTHIYNLNTWLSLFHSMFTLSEQW
jgi:hypothetical protein